MKFELLDSLSLPSRPGKPNDDAFGMAANAAVVLDGATGLGDNLMPGASDAAWLARFGANRLLAHAKEDASSRTAVALAIEEAASSFAALRRRAPAERYELPVASLMFVVATDAGFEALWFGDCAALVKPPQGQIVVLGDAMEKRAAEARRVTQLAARYGLSPASASNRPEFLAALRKARNHANTDKGGWLFGTDIAAADRVSSALQDCAAGSLVLLVSDGFLALVSDYRRYDAAMLFEAVHAVGLKGLGQELRDIETADPDGARYPRFKTSDDATAVLLRVA